MLNIEKDGYIITYDTKKVLTFKHFFKIKSEQFRKFNYNENQYADFKILMTSLWQNMNDQDKFLFFKQYHNKIIS